MKTARERCQTDPVFGSLVDYMVNILKQEDYTPSEMREAAMLASIIHEQNRVKLTVNTPYTEELEKALHIITRQLRKVKGGK